MMPMERFELDAAIVFADLMTPVAALGIDVRFDPGPVLEKPLRSAADIRALRLPSDPTEIAPEVPQTLRLVKQRLDGRANLIGFGGSPFSIAAYLVQGRGGKDFISLRALLREDPVAFGELMDTLGQLVAGYLIEQHKAGADVVQVFDSWAGLLSLPDWELHMRTHLENLIGELNRAGVPNIYFANGAPHLAEAHASLGHPDPARWVLRVYSPADSRGQATEKYFDTPVDIHARQAYLRLSPPGGSFIMELGMVADSGKFAGLTVSNAISLPLDRPSDSLDEKWMMSPEEITFHYNETHDEASKLLKTNADAMGIDLSKNPTSPYPK